MSKIKFFPPPLRFRKGISETLKELYDYDLLKDLFNQQSILKKIRKNEYDQSEYHEPVTFGIKNNEKK